MHEKRETAKTAGNFVLRHFSPFINQSVNGDRLYLSALPTYLPSLLFHHLLFKTFNC